MLESHNRRSAAPGASEQGSTQDVVGLVRAFARIADEADRLPLVVMVPSNRTMHDRDHDARVVPRPRWFLRFFVAEHARRTLGTVRRQLLRRGAVAPDRDDDETSRQSVSMYLDALPARRRVLFSTSLVVLTLFLTRMVLVRIPGAIGLFGGPPEHATAINELLQMFNDVVGDPTSLDMLVAKVRAWPAQTTAFVATSLSTALYLELRPFVPAFRLKRTLFNLDPEPERVTETPSRWGTQCEIGLYNRERSVLGHVGARAPRELPFDLIVPALLLPAAVFLAVLMINTAQLYPFRMDRPPLLYYALGAAILVGVVARAWWLFQTWRHRTASRGASPQLAEPRVQLGLRDPWTMFWVTLGAAAFFVVVGVAQQSPDNPALSIARFFFFVFVAAPLWYRMNRGLSAVLGAQGDGGVAWPILLAGGMAVGGFGSTPVVAAVTSVVALCSVFLTGVRLRRAEAQLDPATRRAWSPVVLTATLLVPPVLLAHVQHVLNGLRNADGTLHD